MSKNLYNRNKVYGDVMNKVKALREQREQAVQLMYLYDVNTVNFSEQIKEVDRDTLLYSLVSGSIDKLPDVDQIISANLYNWSIDRLNLVDKAILRIAVYEIRFTDNANEIAVNEAVELSKKFTEIDDFRSSAFNNKLLDKIMKLGD